MGGTRVDGLRRREAILDAALECFAKRGVMATGIVEVGRKAKASPSSVYHQFGGLEDVLLALLERTFERLFGHLTTRVVSTTSARAAVTTLVDAHLEWVLSNRAEARVMYQAMAIETSSRVTVPLAKRKAEMLAPLVAHLAAFMAKGTLPEWNPLLLDVVVLGAAHEACRRILAGAPIDPAWMRTELPRLAWATVRAGCR